MLYDYLSKAYKEMFKVKELPVVLKFRLNNIAARKLSFEDFLYYFDLKNEYEALDFILDDCNMENIMRYSLEKSKHKNINYYPQRNKKNMGYDDEATKVHIEIENYMQEEDKEYQNKK